MRLRLLVLTLLLVLGSAVGAALLRSNRNDVADRSPAGGDPGARWSPDPGSQWQWQLAGTPELEPGVGIYGMDGQGTPESIVQRFAEQGARTICYISAGTLEAWRPDAHRFPREAIGKPLVDWPDEYWLDVRQLDPLVRLMARRMDECARKGFDAVEADNVDAYAHDTGFPLTPEDQYRYNVALARSAHERGLSIALKNDLGQIEDLEPHYDFAINESCFAYDECDAYAPFLASGKAVLNAEYEESADRCEEAARLGVSSMLKNKELDAWRKPC